MNTTITANGTDINAWTTAAAGGFLVGLALRLRPSLVLGLAAVGGYLLYQEACRLSGGSRRAAIAEPEHPEPRVEANEVDEASWESFPASDPPAYSARRPEAS